MEVVYRTHVWYNKGVGLTISSTSFWLAAKERVCTTRFFDLNEWLGEYKPKAIF